ncbi:MAG: cardiolipin synthase [Finegoldia sp.]|nr:cardiolipin synthase [Finegoldia sp.]
MKRIYKVLSNRMIWLAVFTLINIGIIASFFAKFQSYIGYYYLVNFIFSLMFTGIIVRSDTDPNFKISWLIFVWIFPLMGAFFYLFSNNNIFVKKLRKDFVYADQYQRSNIYNKGNAIDELDPRARSIASYVDDVAVASVYPQSGSKYYRVGDLLFEDMLEDLKNAKKNIFIEFFIIDTGYMLDQILEVLIQKVKEGVDVRVMYDDIGSMTKVPKDFDKTLESYGIKVHVFNRLKLIVLPHNNNRSHRKMAIIDGEIAYTGGLNIADEYINKKVRFGHWKDTGVRIVGEAVWSFLVIYLSFWNMFEDQPTMVDEKYYYLPKPSVKNQGHIQPYESSPISDSQSGKGAYMQLITRATDYFYIMTPYLIPPFDMLEALKNAARSGVDVRIMTPKIPDKKLIFLATRSYYEELLESGVRIFEYTPGFIHAKTCVSDDRFACVGSINLDYRSLYLHFENAVMFYDCDVVLDAKNDFIETQKECDEIFIPQARKSKAANKFMITLLRIFAPLL